MIFLCDSPLTLLATSSWKRSSAFSQARCHCSILLKLRSMFEWTGTGLVAGQFGQSCSQLPSLCVVFVAGDWHSRSFQIRRGDEHQCRESVQHLPEEGPHCGRLRCGHCHLESGGNAHHLQGRASLQRGLQHLRRIAMPRRGGNRDHRWARRFGGW